LNTAGCLHTETLNLVVNYSTSLNLPVTACDQYTWHGTTYTNSGTYTFTSLNASGCLHTETLNLVLIPSSTTNSSATACDSYTWNGTVYTLSGVYSVTSGCQTSILNLTIIPSSTLTYAVQQCGSYTWPLNGITYTSSGAYSFTQNCVTHILNLVVTPVTGSSDTVTACDSYVWNVNGTTYTQSGFYTFSNACQTSTLLLTIQASSTNTTSATACNSYTWNVNNQTYTTGGTYTVVSGCLNQILQLTLNQSPTIVQNEDAVNSYYWPVTGQTYSQSGTYSYNTSNGTDCDSIYILNLSLIPMIIYADQEISCHGFNDGAIQVFISAPGPWQYSVDGGSYQTNNGLFFGMAPGTHTFCATNGAHVYCDTFGLIEPDPLQAVLVVDSVVSCAGNDGAFSLMASGGTNILQGYITFWMNSAGDTVNDVINDNFALYLLNLPADTYHVLIEDDNGCFATATEVMPQAPPITIQASAGYFPCGASNTTLQVNASGGLPYDTLSITVNGLPLASSYAAGTYTIVATDYKGCTQSLIYEIHPADSGTVFTQSSCGSYTWSSPGNGLTYTASGIYTHTVQTATGCDSILTLDLTVIPCSATLSIKLYLEGYYDASGVMRPVLMNQGMGNDPNVTDSVEVTLYEANAPYSSVLNSKLPISINGVCELSTGSLTGLYYIGVKHRNTIHTWSSVPVLVGNGNISYDFSTAATQAFGDNQVEVESGVFALYGGDINQDENTDLLDGSILELSVQNFDFGYIETDVNGDGNVDLLDGSLVDSNAGNFIYSVHP